MANPTGTLTLCVDAYCTFSQIQPYLPRRTFNTSTSPTRFQCVEIARDVFQEINGMLDVLGYHIPVASANSTAMRIVGRLNAIGAAADIEGAAYSAGNPQRSEHGDQLREQYQTLYTKLEKGILTLPAATRESDYIIGRKDKAAVGAFYQDSGGSEQSGVFSKGMNF